MGRFRISMASLMGVVGAVGVCMAALVHPSPLWSSAAFSLAIAANVGAVIATIASTGRPRRAAAGFAVAGSVYFTLSLGPELSRTVGLYLITTPLIEWFYRNGVSDPYLFTMTAHSLFSVASGLAGAAFAWWLAPPDGPGQPTPRPLGPS